MRVLLSAVFLAAGLALPVAVQAQTTPKVMATCKDGTSFSGETKSGACRGHGGVKTWQTAAAGTAAMPSGTAAPKTPSPNSAVQKTAMPGQVWVNPASKTYHCASSKWYGKTKKGAYMSAADATAKGYHLAKGESCS